MASGIAWIAACVVSLSVLGVAGNGQAETTVMLDARPAMPDTGKSDPIYEALKEARRLADVLAGPSGPPFHWRVARTMRATGYEDRFGSYVSEHLAVAVKVAPADGDAVRLRFIEQEAKSLFLAGEQRAAEQAYLAGEELRSGADRRGRLGTNFRFLEWLVEAGHLVSAVEFLDQVHWETNWSFIAAVRKVAEAHILAGRRDEGLELLLRRRPADDAPDEQGILFAIAVALSTWMRGRPVSPSSATHLRSPYDGWQ